MCRCELAVQGAAHHATCRVRVHGAARVLSSQGVEMADDDSVCCSQLLGGRFGRQRLQLVDGVLSFIFL
jgi:hypothetical protein